MTYMYPEHTNRALMDTSLNTELTNWRKFVKYNPQSSKVPKKLTSLPKQVSISLGITDPEPLITAVVQLDGAKQVVQSGPNPETTVSFLLKRKVTDVAASPLSFCDSNCYNIIVPCTRGLI